MDQTQTIDPAILNFSLKDTCKQRLKGMFISLRQENPNTMSYLLIVDDNTVKIISAYMKMAELMELGITAIEKLELGRKPFPKMNAIYFIGPTEKSIVCLIKDYEDKKNPQYGVVHLFFSNKLEQNTMSRIASQESLMARVKTFKVFSLDFSCHGEGVFSLEYAEGLTEIFTAKGTSYQNSINECANKLSTLLISFDKFYAFELTYNQSDNRISEDVATATQKRLNELFRAFEKSGSEQYDRQEKKCGKISVLILDRSIDPLTPLLHDFFYQPMIYDLLCVENDICDYEQDATNGSKATKKMVLSDNDDIFKRYKFRHIGEVLEGVPQEFRNFVNTNTTARLQQGQLQNLDLSKMSEIVKSMPQYNELLSKYTLHMKLIERSWGIFEKKDLREIGELEQSLATGVDKDGKSISPIKILTQVGMKLLNDSLDDYDKLRLLLITTISLEMAEKDRKTLTDKIKPEFQKAVLNLIYLGVNAQKGSSKSKSSNRISDTAKKLAKNKMANATLDLCRNTPAIELIVEQFVENGFKKLPKFESITINEERSKSISENNSLRKNKKKGLLANMMNNEADPEQINNMNKLVIFMIGGIGYNEIRTILTNPKICSQQITIVGSTKILKPNDFVTGLLDLKSNQF